MENSIETIYFGIEQLSAAIYAVLSTDLQSNKEQHKCKKKILFIQNTNFCNYFLGIFFWAIFSEFEFNQKYFDIIMAFFANETFEQQHGIVVFLFNFEHFCRDWKFRWNLFLRFLTKYFPSHLFRKMFFLFLNFPVKWFLPLSDQFFFLFISINCPGFFHTNLVNWNFLNYSWTYLNFFYFVFSLKNKWIFKFAGLGLKFKHLRRKNEQKQTRRGRKN